MTSTMNHDVRKHSINQRAILQFSSEAGRAAQVANVGTQADADHIGRDARKIVDAINSNIVYAPERLAAGNWLMGFGAIVLLLAIVCGVSNLLQPEVPLLWACITGGLGVLGCVFSRLGVAIRYGYYLPVVVQGYEISEALSLHRDIGEDTGPTKPGWVEPVTLAGHVIEVSLIMLMVFGALSTFLPFWAAVVLAFVIGGIAAPILLEVSRRAANYLATLRKVRIRYRNLRDTNNIDAAERLRRRVGSRVGDKFSEVTAADYAFPVTVILIFIIAVVAVCVLRVLMGDAEANTSTIMGSALLGFVTVTIFLGTIAIEYHYSSIAGAMGETAARILAHWPSESVFKDDMNSRRLANENLMRSYLAEMQQAYARKSAKRDPTLGNGGVRFELPPPGDPAVSNPPTMPASTSAPASSTGGDVVQPASESVNITPLPGKYGHGYA